MGILNVKTLFDASLKGQPTGNAEEPTSGTSSRDYQPVNLPNSPTAQLH